MRFMQKRFNKSIFLFFVISIVLVSIATMFPRQKVQASVASEKLADTYLNKYPS